MGKITKTRRQSVSLATAKLVDAKPFSPEQPLPLVIEPVVADMNLIAWAQNHREYIQTQLLKHGGILFRNFKVKSVEVFTQFIQTLADELLEYTYQSTPRSPVSGNVYTSTQYPANQSIPLHSEMAYARNWPLKIWFFCQQAAQQGGATPIADNRRVWQRIAPDIKTRFMARQVMYIRNYYDGIDLPWSQVFQTQHRTEVEAYCQQAGIHWTWGDNQQLHTHQVCQAVATHPKTQEHVWFNQAHLFHVSALPEAARRSLLRNFKPHELPRHACYGDGSPIEDSVLEEIRAIYQQEAVRFSWQEGDILMLDNMLISHGREPFVGPRRVVVGMAESC